MRFWIKPRHRRTKQNVKCSICNSPDCEKINDWIRDGYGLNEISRMSGWSPELPLTGFHRSTIQRHRSNPQCYRAWLIRQQSAEIQSTPDSLKHAQVQRWLQNDGKVHVRYVNAPPGKELRKFDPAKVGKNDLVIAVVFDKTDKFTARNPGAFLIADWTEALEEHKARGFVVTEEPKPAEIPEREKPELPPTMERLVCWKRVDANGKALDYDAKRENSLLKS